MFIIVSFSANDKPIWIISDARRKTDLQWFKENYVDKCKTIRISSSEEVRKNRGWKFCKGKYVMYTVFKYSC